MFNDVNVSGGWKAEQRVRWYRMWDTRSGKSATKIPTPGTNLYLAWSPHDPNLMATGSDTNVVSFIDIRRNKVLKSVKNHQLVRCFKPVPSFCPGILYRSSIA